MALPLFSKLGTALDAPHLRCHYSPKTDEKVLPSEFWRDFTPQLARAFLPILAEDTYMHGSDCGHQMAAHNERPSIISACFGDDRLDPNSRDDYDCTPLHYCALYNFKALGNARALVKRGAQPKLADAFDMLPLHFAMANAKSPEIADLLAPERDMVNAKDRLSRRPLHFVAMNQLSPVGESPAATLTPRPPIARRRLAREALTMSCEFPILTAKILGSESTAKNLITGGTRNFATAVNL